MGYAVSAKNADAALAEINRILDQRKLLMKTVQIGGTEGNHRLHFTVEAKYRDQVQFGEELRKCAELERVELLHESEID
jgi:hypothetical protein